MVRTERPVEESTLDSFDGVLALPWYYSWWRVALLAVSATLAVAGLITWAVDRTPGSDSVDVGFLQDMRTHHDQAVQMSLSFLNKSGVDPTLRTIAAEILLSQQQETGVMVDILHNWGVEEENSTGTSMGWMGEKIPTERMPGMATDAQLAQLDTAAGRAADQLFIALMTAHHQGGIHMAQYAGAHAEQDRVRGIASGMAVAQQQEVDELATISARLGSAG